MQEERRCAEHLACGGGGHEGGQEGIFSLKKA